MNKNSVLLLISLVGIVVSVFTPWAFEALDSSLNLNQLISKFNDPNFFFSINIDSEFKFLRNIVLPLITILTLVAIFYSTRFKKISLILLIIADFVAISIILKYFYSALVAYKHLPISKIIIPLLSQSIGQSILFIFAIISIIASSIALLQYKYLVSKNGSR